ncbi:MAG: FAD-binding oxidoreductase [Candidatus Saganbacteria bacterium]|nr:FAD-binding oxidoreductase [Candidatus Saganbacteria bacterium]
MSVIVIGGGIVGAAAAYYLTEAGLKDITLIEREKLLGTQVTQYCSGGVRHQFNTEINCKFSIESMKTISALAEKIDYKKYGYLILDMEPGMTEPRVQMQRKLGINSESLTPHEIKQRWPFLDVTGVISGSFYAEDGIADPSMLLEHYETNAKKKGAKFLLETSVKRMVKEDNRVIGVETDKDLMKADWVVLAAGVQSKELGQTIGLDIPIVDKRKYVFQIEGFDFDHPLVMEIPLGWYIKKEGSDALIGMSGKVETKPFAKQEESMIETVEASINRVPEVEKKGIKKTLSSLSDETPDKHAVIDSPLPGLIIATGFSGHGFMHSPATGRIVANMVKGELPLIDISELKLGRQQIRETVAI